MLLLNDNFEDLLPLLTSWVTSRWVLGTGLEKENLFILHFLDVLEHTIQVEGFGHWAVVSEILFFKTGISDDVMME
jgi:hypothetical protein